MSQINDTLVRAGQDVCVEMCGLTLCGRVNLWAAAMLGGGLG